MTDVALQIGPSGFTVSIMPEVLDVGAVTARTGRWPVYPHGHNRVPDDMYDRILGHRLLGEVLYEAEVDHVFLAIEEGTDMRRVGALETTLDDLDVAVVIKDPHPDGALGIMREAVQEFIDDLPAPPGM